MPKHWSPEDRLVLLASSVAHAAGGFGTVLCQLDADLRQANGVTLAAVFGAAINVALSFELARAMAHPEEGQEAHADPDTLTMALYVTSATHLSSATGQPVDLQATHLTILQKQLGALLKQLDVTTDVDLYLNMRRLSIGRWVVDRAGLRSVGDHLCGTIGDAVLVAAASFCELLLASGRRVPKS